MNTGEALILGSTLAHDFYGMLSASLEPSECSGAVFFHYPVLLRLEVCPAGCYADRVIHLLDHLQAVHSNWNTDAVAEWLSSVEASEQRELLDGVKAYMEKSRLDRHGIPIHSDEDQA